MTTKCSVFIAASVDGFIARPDGDVGWLHKPEYAMPDGTDFGYAAFMANIDALVMGRKSFEKVQTFTPWPYEGTPVVVLSSRPIDLPAALREKVIVRRGEPGDVVRQLANEGKRRLYIDGGQTIGHFLRARLIDEITITRIPMLLGSGIPLFDLAGFEASLRHIRTEAYANGFVQTTYAVAYDNG